eukprot:457550_1
MSPSGAPSAPPTLSPTRFPTAADEYDAYFNIIYEIQNLTQTYLTIVVKDPISIMSNIERIIEEAYVANADILKYKDFWVTIESVNNIPIPNIVYIKANSQLLLRSKVLCNSGFCEHWLKQYRYTETKFEQTAQEKLRTFFDEKYIFIHSNDSSNNRLKFSIYGNKNDLVVKLINPPPPPWIELLNLTENIFVANIAFISVCFIFIVGIIFRYSHN